MTHPPLAPRMNDQNSSRDEPAMGLLLRVKGIVQGVGFRPFVHRTASDLGLRGWVRNTFEGSEIWVEGPAGAVRALVRALQERPPPMARIDAVEATETNPKGLSDFRIDPSVHEEGEAALVSPDMSVCADCLREMRDPTDRRYRYPFINCTNCGPRFAIVQQVPYDRAATTMSRFNLCDDCSREYRDPRDRRYHAQPNACARCGPTVRLLAPSGHTLADAEAAIARAREMLNDGGIVAVKGLGGFHLACDATRADVVRRLRERKPRPHRPLAVMCRDMDAVRAHCQVSEREASELASPRRPILLLPRRVPSQPGATPLAAEVAPGHEDLGVMLPYTPLHEMLLEQGAPGCLVMTSGNRTAGPIESTNEGALRMLGRIADALLVHDRDIWNRCDDSVAVVRCGTLMLMRRSRGFVPLPVVLPAATKPTLAVGAMYANVFAVAQGTHAFLSQHIGDVDNVQTAEFQRESIEKLRAWLGVRFEVVAHDLHPDLLTTHLAMELGRGAKTVAVQHHHAHFAAALTSCGYSGEAQGLVLDGTGYGLDGTIWGGELLVGGPRRVRRAGHLQALALPGGEAAIRRPLRIAVAYLHAAVPEAQAMPLDLWHRAVPGEIEVIRRMVDRRFNTPMTTSVGRLFDAVASLLGVRDEVTYEGQAAIELEQLARGGHPHATDVRFGMIERDGKLVIDPAPVLRGLAKGLVARKSAADLAMGFHEALADAFAHASGMVRDRGGPRVVALCGGVFQNRILIEQTVAALAGRGLTALEPGSIPVNDGGLALGQVVVANAVVDDLAPNTVAGWET